MKSSQFSFDIAVEGINQNILTVKKKNIEPYWNYILRWAKSILGVSGLPHSE